MSINLFNTSEIVNRYCTGFNGYKAASVNCQNASAPASLAAIPNDKFEKRMPDAYVLGEERNGQRIIDKNSVRVSLIPYDTSRNNCPRSIRPYFDKNSLIVNRDFDDFMQGRQGDCYLLSSIYSINMTKNGKNALKNNIQYNEDGTITVTLPGALKAKKAYEEEGTGDKCAITGKYTITKEALEKAKAFSGKTYAYGDIEIVINELALEAFRAEVMETNKTLGQKISTMSDVVTPGVYTGNQENNPLGGGTTFDATYILTGKKSELYWAPKDKKIRPYKYGEFGFVGDKNRFVKDAYFKLCKHKGEKSVTVIYDKDSDLQKMLDKYKGQEDKFAITVGVKVAEKGPDGATKAGGGHALSVSKITDDFVEVVNPWNTTKKERIPRDIFEQMATKFSVAAM